MRTRILRMLDERVASPRQLSRELDAPLQNVSYHVRELAKLDLIKLVRTTQRRGAIEHHYRAVATPHISDAAWSELPTVVRQRMTAAGLAEIFKQVNDAATGGGFDSDDAHLSRTKLVLDDKGRKALNKELEAMLGRVEKLQAQAKQRLGNDHASQRRMTLVLLGFDDVAAPDERPAKSRSGGTRSRSRRSSRTRSA
jgi:DNA-binding transcriptional ArsR family regulator